MNLYANDGSRIGRTLDIVWSWRRWGLGVKVRRWRLFMTDEKRQRTVCVDLGPLHFTTWKLPHDNRR